MRARLWSSCCFRRRSRGAREQLLFLQARGWPPDWPVSHLELKRSGVTLSLLWEEGLRGIPRAPATTSFCDLYRAWKGKLKPTMRQAHVAGEEKPSTQPAPLQR